MDTPSVEFSVAVSSEEGLSEPCGSGAASILTTNTDDSALTKAGPTTGNAAITTSDEASAWSAIAADSTLKPIVEAILFAAGKPMSAKQIQQVFPELERPELLEIDNAIAAIAADYQMRPIHLQQVASGYRFQVKTELSRWVGRLFEEKPPKYSRALLETLAIIAYRQPVTRGDIEDIRGVSVSSSIIQTLLEREWVRVVAHKEVPGRPALYGTTKQFLDYFNLSSLNGLPAIQDIAHLDLSQ